MTTRQQDVQKYTYAFTSVAINEPQMPVRMHQVEMAEARVTEGRQLRF